MNDLAPRSLVRSRNDRTVLGVCGGVGHYLNVDPTLVRIGFVAATLLGGPGLIAYLVLALLMPEEPVTA